MSELPKQNTNFYFFIYLNIRGNESQSHLKEGQSVEAGYSFIFHYQLEYFSLTTRNNLSSVLFSSHLSEYIHKHKTEKHHFLI